MNYKRHKPREDVKKRKSSNLIRLSLNDYRVIDQAPYLWYHTDMKDLITQDPNILGGKPIISGTRMSVEVILEFLAGGMEIKEILKEYPFLTKAQVEAAVNYAAKIVGKQESYIFDTARTLLSKKSPHEIHSRR